MPLFRRSGRAEPPRPPSAPPEDLVRAYLRGQNMEQVQRTDEAIALYEQAVVGGFDSAGPYDRLIYIYRAREEHAAVVRVAEAALTAVRTFEDKRSWYEGIRAEAAKAQRERPDARGAEF